MGLTVILGTKACADRGDMLYLTDNLNHVNYVFTKEHGILVVYEGKI